MAPMATHLLVFGDQVIDKRSMIRNLVRNSKSSSAARTFLQESTDLVQNELNQLTPDEHGWSGNFESLLGLAEEHAAHEVNHGSLLYIATLTCLIGRLGDLIVRAERDPTILGSKENPTHVLALCAGQLPAAVAVAARDTSELLAIAREIISITSRWLRAVHRIRLAMISPHQTGGWSITYTGLDRRRVQTILDEFHASQDLPAIHRLSIAVVSRSWLTLVGPASSHRRLAEFSQDIRRAPQIPADVGAPAHAPFMAGVDAAQLIGHSALLDRALDWQKIKMVSPSGDCGERQHATLRELLIDIFEDILGRPLLVDDVIESSVSRLDPDAKVYVHEVGNTPYTPAVLKTLNIAGLITDVVPPCRRPPLSSGPTRGNSDLIAVVGMSGRFPGGDNLTEFWTELMNGACHIKRVPESRFDLDRYYDVLQKLKNSTNVTDGAWLNEPGSFDNRFFNISPREATQMDPAQRLCLTVTQEALEMAGYAPHASPSMDPRRVSTWIGDTNWDWPETVHEQGTDIYYAGAIGKAFLSGRLNYHYKFGRGAYSLDSACASSTTAITLACKSLLSRDSDMAVAGGVSVLTAPYTFSGLARSGMLAPQGGCRTYHDDADGYVRGEGVGIVILKRLEDAVADRDHILGVISGSARTYSAASTSITHPSHVSQAKIYREVLGQMALDPEEIAYVEMHGTGTQAGDFEELTSVVDVLGGQRRPDNPLTVGAVKAAMGHGEGVAGVTALIKSLLMLKHRMIPSQPGVPFKVNHRFPPLDERNVHIAMETKPLVASPKAADGKIKILVNTFDASGGICSLILQEPPDMDFEGAVRSQDMRSHHVVTLSARSNISLQKNRENLLHYLERNPDTCLSDLAYTTAARRIHTTLRTAFVSDTIGDLVRQLRQQPTDRVKATQPPRAVFLFTGQGSQYQSMGMGLYKTSSRFRDMMETYQLTASHLALPQFLPIISGAMDITTASPTQVQLATLALELGVSHMLRSWGIVPDVVVGHSLGEYAALCVAGVLSPSDALYLVGRRGLLMEKLLTPNTHAMLATSLSAQDLTSLIRKENVHGRLASCAAACHNAPGATVASGTEADVRALQDILTREGMRSTLLRVPFGFHSAQVDPILGDFERIAAGVTFKKPIIPVASTLLGRLVDADGVFSPSYLARQAREPVSFVEGLRAAASLVPGNMTMWIETGPSSACLSMARETLKLDNTHLLPVLKPQKDNMETASAILKVAYELGATIDWKAYHGEHLQSLKLLPDLPTYGWDYSTFWTPYTAPPVWEVEKAFALARNSEYKAIEAAPEVEKGFVPTFSVHKLVEEKRDESSGKVSVVFASETSRPGLKKAVEGHVVSGHAIVPLFIFCDMAVTCAKHCYFRVHDSVLDTARTAIQDIAITHAVVLTANSKPTVLTSASYSGGTDYIDVTFHEETKSGKRGPLVGQCRVNLSATGAPKPVTPALHQNLFFIRTRMQQLQELASTGKAHRLLRDVVYRLFGGCVRYGPEYLSMDEVIVSTGSQDALATITAPMGIEASTSAMNPWVYDGVNQLTGFLLNNSLRCADDQVMHLFEGFSEQQQWEPLVPGRKYTTYAAGQDMDETGSVVDVISYVFDAESGKLVQMSTGLRATKVKKIVLDHILGDAADSLPRHAAPAAPVAKASSHVATPPAVMPVNVQKERTEAPAISVDVEVPALSLDTPSNATLIRRVLDIVAAELNVDPENITDDTVFSELGLDSMMSITILLTVRNELDIDLPFGFFIENETVSDAKRALPQYMSESAGIHDAPSSPEHSTSSLESLTASVPGTPPDISIGIDPEFTPRTTPSHSPENTPDLISTEFSKPIITDINQSYEDNKLTWTYPKPSVELPEVLSSPPPALEPPTLIPPTISTNSEPKSQCKITPLQSPPQAASSTAPLYLFAPESSSAVSYVQLPAFDRHVWGVDWPTDFAISSPETTSSLLSSLADALATSILARPSRETTPSPIILGGLSFGAVLAFEVARRLPADRVAGVLMLDPPGTAGEVRARGRRGLMMGREGGGGKVGAAERMMENYAVQIGGRGERGGEKVVLVVPETGEGGEIWRDWIPEAEVRAMGNVKGGGFWKFPAINAVGAVCRDVVGGMK